MTVQYATANGSALAGSDYTAVSGTLTFMHDSAVEGPNGSYLLTVTVPLAYVDPFRGVTTYVVNLSGATNATISKAQGLGTILPPPTATHICDDGNPCTNDFCDPTAGCKHVDISACVLGTPPICGSGGSCFVPLCSPGVCNIGDADGDGLSDAWERSGGIDLNCDGVLTPDEMVLTNVDPFFPDGTPNPNPSADPAVKDIFVKYDWMELPDQLTNGQPTACTVNPLPFPNNLIYPFHSDQCDWDELCLNNVCKGHSDAPDPAALMMVIEAFARHNIRLHLAKGHALPHANVIALGPPVSACVSTLSTQTFLGAHAADFYADYKASNFNATYNGQTFDFAHLFPVFHYAVFAHRHTCDSPADCAQLACMNGKTLRQPLFNETGLAEQPGNDIIVSMGGFRDRNVTPPIVGSGRDLHARARPQPGAEPRRADLQRGRRN